MGHFGGSVDGSASILATLLITLLIISMLCAARFKSKFIPESGITLLVGIAAGMIIKLVLATDPKSPSLMSDLINFNPIIFLVIQLPPIIFNSGFNIDTGLLGQYFRAIFLFAVVGTTISATFITFFLWFVPTEILDLSLAELATFGALISATDPVSTLSVFSEKRVNLQLFYLVFGESVVNDAVGLVLFDTASQIVSHPEQTFNFGESALNLLFVFAASFLLGILMAIFFALIFKYAKFSHKQQLIEVSEYDSRVEPIPTNVYARTAEHIRHDHLLPLCDCGNLRRERNSYFAGDGNLLPALRAPQSFVTNSAGGRSSVPNDCTFVRNFGERAKRREYEPLLN